MNSKGSYRTTTANMMRAYDRLPAPIRQALAEAKRNYAPQPVLTKWRRGWAPELLVKLIAIWDRQERERDKPKKRGGGR